MRQASTATARHGSVMASLAAPPSASRIPNGADKWVSPRPDDDLAPRRLTLDVYVAEPRGWDQSEVTALQAYAGVVANLLGAAAKAQLRGVLADQLQTALDSRGVIERAKGALMERERLDDQEAFTHLRRAARSSGRKLTEVAREVAAGKPLPHERARPTPPSAEPAQDGGGSAQPDA
jgi:hypothetical protein